MKIRIKFRKYGVMKFIGHLDMMRYFQKCMRRANIDIAYSEGYSPHQIMSFAAPLGVGLTSDGEYLDIEVHDTRSCAASIEALNAVMVEGVEVTSYRKLSDNEKNAMSIVAAADYEITYKNAEDAIPIEELLEHKQHFFEDRTEVMITKKTKKSEKEMDLKQLVYGFEIREKEGLPVFYFDVCTGSTDNLKPELVLEAFYQFMGKEYVASAFQIHRIDVYGKTPDGKGFLSLGEMGEFIE